MDEQLRELGFYGLAGHSDTPRDLVTEAADAERLGLGSVFLSERFNFKDAAVMSGAAGAVTEHLGVATGATNHNTRHPMVTATFATTMHRLTDGRFALGLGRGFDGLFQVMGLPTITMAPARGHHRPAAADVARRDDLRPRGPGGQLRLPRSGPVVRRGHPDHARRPGREDPRVRRQGDGRGDPAHVLLRPGPRAGRGRGAPRGRAGRSGSAVGAGLVGAGDRGRSHRRGPPAQEARRSAGHVPAGLRRRPGAGQRLGSGGARALPGRRAGEGRSPVPSTPWPRPISCATSPSCSRRSGWPPRPRARPSSARRRCSASSTSAPTA